MSPELMVRDATDSDAEAIAAIYAGYVLDTVITFDLVPPSVEDWRVKAAHIQHDGWPFLVGTADGVVVGFAYVSEFRSKAAYRYTVEDTIYLSPSVPGRGYGSKLFVELLRRAASAGARQVVAVIAHPGNPASIALHERAGFDWIGVMPKVGFKFDRWVDTLIMQWDVSPTE
jgi:L-amino acid N-acyltransferase YncA